MSCFFDNLQTIPNFGLLFFHGKSYALTLRTNGLGYILGDFFTNSSGHTAARWYECVHCSAVVSVIKFAPSFLLEKRPTMVTASTPVNSQEDYLSLVA
jgi:hypothetical protein